MASDHDMRVPGDRAAAGVRRSAPPIAFVGEAIFHGHVALWRWTRRDVEALLPSDLELAPRTPAPTAGHPVVFLFGAQTSGATRFGGISFPTGIEYREVGLAIPFVRRRGGTRPHTFVPRMYASYFPPVWHGNVHYGFGKELAEIRTHGPMLVVSAPGGELILHAAVEPRGEWGAGLACPLESLRVIRESFALPIVGRLADGELVCSDFGWDFTAADVRLADSLVSFDTQLFAGCPPRLCPDVPDGTVEVRGMIWRLGWPRPCDF